MPKQRIKKDDMAMGREEEESKKVNNKGTAGSHADTLWEKLA